MYVVFSRVGVLGMLDLRLGLRCLLLCFDSFLVSFLDKKVIEFLSVILYATDGHVSFDLWSLFWTFILLVLNYWRFFPSSLRLVFEKFCPALQKLFHGLYGRQGFFVD